MKDSAGNKIKAGDVLKSLGRKIYMTIDNGDSAMFRYMGKDQGAGDKFRMKQAEMENSKWVKVE